MNPRWQVDCNALDAGGLRIALQRIGASDWRPDGVLRSWGLAPMHRADDVLWVPCGDGEVLWLGAWPEPAGGAGTLSLRDAARGPGTQIAIPAQQAITSLGEQQPIARPPGVTTQALQLAVAPRAGAPLTIDLLLMAPQAWSARTGRPWTALTGPPPLPPRLG